jgi:GNAT superfamily N-acetyltransferase
MAVSRRIAPLTLDNLSDLPSPCRTCVYWEAGPTADNDHPATDERALLKEAWLSATMLDWGSCGKIAYLSGLPVGYVMFAPPGFVPRSTAFPTSPVSGDAVLLITARVLPDSRGTGIGRMLAQAVAGELVPRGVKAVEAFGTTGMADPSVRVLRGGAPGGCLLPVDYLRSVGFKTVRPHPRYPRMRLELKSTVSWRYDVEYALERIFGTATGKALTPAGSS